MAMLYLRNKPIGAISSGASGGGHTIENPSGTDMTQRSNLQFTDADVADDSTNDRTEISVVRKLTQAEYDELTPEEQNRGVIVIKDANPIYVPSNNAVSVTADGVKTAGELLLSLYHLIDFSKVTNDATLVFNNANGTIYYLSIGRKDSNKLYFYGVFNADTATEHNLIVTVDGTTALFENCMAKASSPYVSFQDYSSVVLDDGTTIILYYNSITKVIESCDAQDVSYGNSNVKAALDELTATLGTYTQVTSFPFTLPYNGYIRTYGDGSTQSERWYQCEIGYIALSATSGNDVRYFTKGMTISQKSNGVTMYYYPLNQ